MLLDRCKLLHLTAAALFILLSVSTSCVCSLAQDTVITDYSYFLAFLFCNRLCVVIYHSMWRIIKKITLNHIVSMLTPTIILERIRRIPQKESMIFYTYFKFKYYFFCWKKLKIGDLSPPPGPNPFVFAIEYYQTTFFRRKAARQTTLVRAGDGSHLDHKLEYHA